MRRSGKSINSIADHFGIAWDTANQLVSAEYIDPRIERAISRREAGESISKIARELHASKRKIRSWVGHIELGEDPRKPHVRELRLQGYSLRQISRKTGVSWRVVKRWTSDITPGILAIPQHEEAKSLFQKGMNYQEIADYMGIPKTTVFRWVNNPRKRHYKRHRNNPQPSRQIIRYKKPRPMSQEEKRLKARELYQSRDPEILFGGKPSIPKIATKLGISTGTLYSWRKRGLLGPLFTRDDLIDAAMRLYQSNDPEIMTRGRPSAPKIARKLGISQPSINKWLRAGLLWEIPDKEQLIKRGKELFQSCDPEIMTARVPYHPSPLKIAAVINAESGLSLDPTTIWHWIKRGLLGKEPVCERSLTLLQKRAKELYQGCNPEIMGFLHGFPTGKPSIPKIARKLGKRRRAISRWLNEGLMGDEPECDVELTEPQERAKELYQSCDPEIRVRYRGGRLSDKPSLSAIGRRVGVSGPTIKNWIDRGLLGNDPFRRRRYRHNPQPSRQVIRYKKLVPQSKQELMNFIESQTTEPSKNGSQIDDGLLAKHARKSGNPEPSSAAKGNYRTRGIKHAALPAARYQSFSNERITL
jgi:transposase